MLDSYRDEDAGDTRKGEVNELVENMTTLTALEGQIWKDEKSWKSKQNIIMKTEFVKIIVKNEMMHCYMREHVADRYWLHECSGGHASRREPTMRKFTQKSTTYFVCVQVEHPEDAIRIQLICT